MPGTPTKADIIKTIQREKGYSRKKAAEMVETLLELIKSTLESGKKFSFRALVNSVFTPKKNDAAGIRLQVKI